MSADLTGEHALPTAVALADAAKGYVGRIGEFRPWAICAYAQRWNVADWRIVARQFGMPAPAPEQVADAVTVLVERCAPSSGGLPSRASLITEIERLRTAILDAEQAILGDGTSEGDLRLHEALSPLWAAAHIGRNEQVSS